MLDRLQVIVDKCCTSPGLGHMPHKVLSSFAGLTAEQFKNAINQETMDSYYSLLEDILTEHNLLDNPAQIYNMDESGMPLNPRPPNIIAKRGQ